MDGEELYEKQLNGPCVEIKPIGYIGFAANPIEGVHSRIKGKPEQNITPEYHDSLLVQSFMGQQQNKTYSRYNGDLSPKNDLVTIEPITSATTKDRNKTYVLPNAAKYQLRRPDVYALKDKGGVN